MDMWDFDDTTGAAIGTHIQIVTTLDWVSGEFFYEISGSNDGSSWTKDHS